MKNDFIEFIHREKGPAHNPSLTIELKFPYQPDFSNELKRMVGYGNYCWESDLQTWFIHLRNIARVVDLAKDYWGRVYVVDLEGTSVNQRTNIAEPKQEDLFG